LPITAPPATALHRCGQANRNPPARQAGRPESAHSRTASHFHSPLRASNRPDSPPHTPDTSTANRSFPNPLGGKPRACGLPSGEDGLGREKRNRRPGAGQRAKPATRGRRLRFGNERVKPLVFPPNQKWKRSASLCRDAAQEQHHCGRCNTDGRPARGLGGQRAFGKERRNSASGSVLVPADRAGYQRQPKKTL
jgi:hypothetical protein